MSEKNINSNEESTMETWTDGRKVWRDNKRKYHRLDGPAYESPYGSKEWWIHGKCHRIDGPAVELSNGSKSWWIHGKCHRVDGPAIERYNGSKEWWIHDKFIVKLEPKTWSR